MFALQRGRATRKPSRGDSVEAASLLIAGNTSTTHRIAVRYSSAVAVCGSAGDGRSVLPVSANSDLVLGVARRESIS